MCDRTHYLIVSSKAATAAAIELNRKRWAKTTKAERSEAARRAANARWARKTQTGGK